MGFKGFSSYMKRKKKYFCDYKLSSSILIIDGNNIASTLYREASKTNYIFNGDYDVFAEAVRTFFIMLLHSNIKPLVILDGGYELRKLNAIQARLLLSTRDIARLRKEKNSDPFLPVLILEVFKEVMLNSNIRFMQSRYEADMDIVELAKCFNCPILSSDSDYYFCDAGFIPFASLKFPRENEVDTFISCKIFMVESFLKDFGGLPDKSFLPLLALLLGDHMEIKHFRRLYLSLLNGEEEKKKFKLTDYDGMLRILCTWFSKLESINAAIPKIEESVPLQFKRFLRKQLKLLLERQSIPYESSLIDLLNHSKITHFESQLCSQLEVLELADVESQTPKLITCLSPTGKTVEIPHWFLESEKKGLFPRHVSNILNLRTVLLWTQLESFELPSVYTISFPILRVVAGIILSTSKRSRSAPLTCYVRTGCDIGKKLLIPDYPSDSVSFSNLHYLPLNTRQKILLNALQIDNFSSENLPQEWPLFYLTVMFWFKNSELFDDQKLIYTGAFILSFLLVSLAEENQLPPSHYHSPQKIVCDRIPSPTNKSPVSAEYQFTSEKVMFNKISMTAGKPMSNAAPHKVETDLKCDPTNFVMFESNRRQNDELHESLADFTNCSSDLLRNKDLIKNLHNMTKNSSGVKLSLVKIFCRLNSCECKEIDRLVTHFYAQLQTVLQFILMLNSVVNFAYPQTVISKCMSGSLIFKLVTAIKKSSSLSDFISSLTVDPIIRNLFLACLKFIEDNLSCNLTHEYFCHSS